MDWKEKINRGLEKRTILCVGLDTDMDRLKRDFDSQIEVNRLIVDETKNLAAAYKPNLAFYEKEGEEGIKALSETVDHIKRNAPDALIILDGKKGDIGNTSKAYAAAAYEKIGADAVTLNGYMGRDVIDPFLEYEDKLNFVLCRTSNPSAREMQDLKVSGMPLYLKMADMIREWNQGKNLGMVVGATYPEELGRIRELVGYDIPILVPGIGTQGGDLKAVLEKGTEKGGRGILINVSRGIMFAYQRKGMTSSEIGKAARMAAATYVNNIRDMLEDLGRW